MNKWRELKSDNITLYKVDVVDISALFILYDNCHRMGNENNNNVWLATVDPEAWFDDLVPDILNNVSFVTKMAGFQTLSINGGELLTHSYICDKVELESLKSLKDFLEERGRLSVLVVYSVVQYVDLKKLKPTWILRYKEITDTQTIRDKKIDYLTNEL